MRTVDDPAGTLALIEAALDAHAHGLAVVPPREDGSKRPDGTWKSFQSTRPTEAQVRAWYANGRLGLGYLTGAVSGNLELLELDHGGIDPDTGELLTVGDQWRAFVQAARDAGCFELLDRVIAGYVEKTPGGGVHLLYRSTGPVDGNLKLARRPATEAELAQRPGDQVKVIFETRGEGGYVIVAPSAGTVHPSGASWQILRGSAATIATIGADERSALLDLARTFDRMPVESEPPTATPTERPVATADGSWMDQTVDAFNQATTWAQILVPHGWCEMRPQGGVGYWCRPGKNPRHGHSATTNANGTDRLIVFSSSVAGFKIADGQGPAPSVDRFGAWAILEHDGNRETAAVQARKAGHGPPWTEPHYSAGDQASMQQVLDQAGGGTSTVIPDPGAGWDKPLPLEGPPPPPFPIASLPDWMAEHCEAVATALQVPVDLCGQLALGVMATIAMGHVKVAIRSSWSEPVNLYLTTVMPSGAGKSPADRAIVGALRKLETKLLAQHAAVRRQAEITLAVAERKAKKALEAAAKDDGDPTAALVAQAAVDAIDLPPEPRLLARDATPEILAQLLQDHGGRMAIVSTEAELYDIVLGTYGNRVNLSAYLAGWSADELIVDRKGGSGSPGTKIRVPAATLTVSITVQPSALEALRTRPELVGRGFVQRFCYSWPTSLVGRRRWDPDDDGHIATTADWEARIDELGTRFASWTFSAEIRMSRAARTRFFSWRQHLEDRLGADEDDGLAEFVAKQTGSVARTAALLHLAAGGGVAPSSDIDDAVMVKAIDLGDYWLAHADAVWLQFGASGSLADARSALAWIRRTRPATFTRRDLNIGKRRRFPDAQAAEAALHTLAEHGWIRPTGTLVGRSKTPNPEYVAHPCALAEGSTS